MNELIKVLGKTLIQMVMWVFILSISWEGRSLYDRAHGVLIENSIVEALDSELADVWSKVSKTAAVTFSEEVKEEEVESF